MYDEIKKKVLTFGGPEWSHISPSAVELLSGLLEKNPAKRYTMEQALAHPWVSGDAAPDTAISRDILSSLLTFNARNKFKKAALGLVASTLSASDVSTLREAFHKIDKDHSGARGGAPARRAPRRRPHALTPHPLPAAGFITYPEMRAALAELGMKDSDTAGVVANVDSDGDGRISYDEFLHAALDKQMIHHQNTIWWAFCEYDLDGDGKITLDELRKVLVGETEENVRRYIEEYDLDKSGCIEYEEFARMLLPQASKRDEKGAGAKPGSLRLRGA